MSFNVVWQRRAEDQLAALWAEAADQQDLADTAEAVDRILRREPLEQGESRDPGTRLWFYRPLQVLYYIDEPARTVFVVAIRWVGR